MSYNGNPQRPTNSWQSAASAADTSAVNTSGQTEWQRRQDSEHLNLLAIFHYIMGGLHGLYTIGMVGYFALIGSFIGTDMNQTRPMSGGPDPGNIFAVILGFGGVMAFLSAVFTGFIIYAGVCIARRQNLVLVQIVAALQCLNVPVGTALGVFTFIVLNRPSVRDLFEPGYLARQYEMHR